MGYAQRTVLAARYCLCTAIDEMVLRTQWGTKSAWVKQSLLTLFHKETWGGERFYLILENMVKDPRQNIAVIELLYLLLSLGFEGKFFDKDKTIREEIRNRVFGRIRHARGKVERALSIHWQDKQPIDANQQKKTSLKRIIIGAGSVFGIILLGFNIAAFTTTSNTISAIKKVGREPAVTAYSQLIDRPIVPHSFE
jgi:type VI secretion system protein ImpK